MELQVLIITDPAVPASLGGTCMAHLSDLHIRANGKISAMLLPQMQRWTDQFGPFDHLMMTGDFMDDLGDEPAAMDRMRELIRRIPSHHPPMGVWGNHDSPLFRQWTRDLPVNWFEGGPWHHPELPLNIFGLHCDSKYGAGDLVASLKEPSPKSNAAERRYRIMLGHLPGDMIQAAAAGMNLTLLGHTHAGQVRFPPRKAWHTSSDFPSHHGTGVLQVRRTLAVISRGVGEGIIPNLRFNCPRQVPVIILSPDETQTAAWVQRCEKLIIPVTTIQPMKNAQQIRSLVHW